MKDAHYTLVKGPSKFDLMMALFDQKGNGGKPHYVTFEADDGQKITAKIQSVGIEDGSGESWIIEGVVMSTQRPTGRRPMKVSHQFDFTGYFQTERRRGWLKPKEVDNSWIADGENVLGPDDAEHWGGLAVDHELERAEHAMAHGAHRH